MRLFDIYVGECLVHSNFDIYKTAKSINTPVDIAIQIKYLTQIQFQEKICSNDNQLLI